MQQELTAESVDIEIPEELDSNHRKLIYLYLRMRREATIDEISNALDMSLLTLYSVLPDLREKGFVTNDGDRWLCRA